VNRLVGSGATRQYAILVVGAALLALVPLILPPDRQAVAVRTLIFAIMAVAWNIMSG
jgi:branched-chain amino acid transport system permease protein